MLPPNVGELTHEGEAADYGTSPPEIIDIPGTMVHQVTKRKSIQ